MEKGRRVARVPTNIRLTPDEQYAGFAALCAMIDDVHAVQDQMTKAQWQAAERLYQRLRMIVDARDAATRPSRR